MQSVLVRRPREDRHTEESQVTAEVRVTHLQATSTWSLQKLEKAGRTPPPRPPRGLKRARPSSHFDFRLLGSRAVRAWISADAPTGLWWSVLTATGNEPSM